MTVIMFDLNIMSVKPNNKSCDTDHLTTITSYLSVRLRSDLYDVY